ncbi:MAG: response regulator [Spirochaeta sp.]|nr:response regulator [Spirochaeta sp.]
MAEDNFTNQTVALGILNKLGLQGEAVANGQEVLKALEMIPYDLVLMDVQMPEMDGVEATLRIRDPRSPACKLAVPIIAMSGHVQQAEVHVQQAESQADRKDGPALVAGAAVWDQETIQEVLTVARAAHLVKGVAGTLCAPALQEIAQEFEASARKAQLDLPTSRLKEWETAFAHLQTEVKRQFDNTSK